jgi:DNA-binding NarL/FixJ family response regulator
MKSINLAIVDDHKILLDGIGFLLSQSTKIDIVKCFNSVQDFLNDSFLEECTMVLTDIRMPDRNGFDLLYHLEQNKPEVKKVVMTMYNSHAIVQNILKYNVQAVFFKNGNSDDLLIAIELVIDGYTYFPDEIKPFIDNFESENLISILTEREIKIIQLLAEELSSKEIAAKLFISPLTVEKHRQNIMSKLKVKNTAGLIMLASNLNIV